VSVSAKSSSVLEKHNFINHNLLALYARLQIFIFLRLNGTCFYFPIYRYTSLFLCGAKEEMGRVTTHATHQKIPPFLCSALAVGASSVAVRAYSWIRMRLFP